MSFTKTDRAILKIAYAILALDGQIADDELRTFRKVAEGFPGFKAGSKETNDLLTEAFAIGERLLTFRKIYSDDELVTALLSLTVDDCSTIKQSRAASKKAFIIWIALALADHNYSPIEKNAVKAFQEIFNLHERLLPQLVPIVSKYGTAVTSAALIPMLSSGFKNLVMGYEHMTHEEYISDSFLSIVESTLKSLSYIQMQMQKCDSEKLAELQRLYDEQSNFLKEQIFSAEEQTEEE